MRAFIIAVALSMAGIAPVAAEPLKLSGTYDVRGTNFDGSSYRGVAKITVTTRDTCRIVWDTGSEAAGICMRNGPAFAASYVMGNAIGLVIYRVRDDGVLEGLWTIADTEGYGTEVLTPRN
jgi:hypothetical protein